MSESRERSLARADGNLPALPRHDQPSTAPIYEGHTLEFVEGNTRDSHWRRLSRKIQENLHRHAGTMIEWWAREDPESGDGRPLAITFGQSAFCIAEPRFNSEHHPVYALSRYELDPTSFQFVTIEHRPSVPSHQKGQPSNSSMGQPTSPAINISPHALSVFGNLPARAQQLLQQPFLAGQQLLRYVYYYEGWESRLNMFAFVLAGPQDITLATGSRLIPVGHNESTAHWSLVCRRARVIRRVGQ